MARKLLKRIMPKTSAIKNNRSLGLLGARLHDPQLWHLNRHSAQMAFFIGIFCAFIPLPIQMIIAAVIAILWRANLPLSVGLVWITNPITIPPIFYYSFRLGEMILQTPDVPFEFELSWHWILNDFQLIWQPLLFGSLLCGAVFGSCGYFAIGWFWRWQVLKRWSERRAERKRRRS